MMKACANVGLPYGASSESESFKNKHCCVSQSLIDCNINTHTHIYNREIVTHTTMNTYFVLLMFMILASSSLAFFNNFKLGSFISGISTNMASAMPAKYPIYCDEDVMKPKEHGTCEVPVMKGLRWKCDWGTADRICCFNRHYAEHSGYFTETSFLSEESAASGEITFYDSVSGKPLFVAPKGRSFEDFVKESKSHGWPSFR